MEGEGKGAGRGAGEGESAQCVPHCDHVFALPACLLVVDAKTSEGWTSGPGRPLLPYGQQQAGRMGMGWSAPTTTAAAAAAATTRHRATTRYRTHRNLLPEVPGWSAPTTTAAAAAAATTRHRATTRCRTHRNLLPEVPLGLSHMLRTSPIGALRMGGTAMAPRDFPRGEHGPTRRSPS